MLVKGAAGDIVNYLYVLFTHISVHIYKQHMCTMYRYITTWESFMYDDMWDLESYIE